MKLHFIHCIVLMIAVSLLMGDGRRETLTVIKIGFGITDDNRTIIDRAVRDSQFYNKGIMIESHLYESDTEMLEELREGKIDMAGLDIERGLFDKNFVDGIKVIMELSISNNTSFGFCVLAKTLEDDTALLFDFANAVRDICSNGKETYHIHIMETDEWIAYYLNKDYGSDIIMKYLVPDFVMEVMGM